MLRATRCAAFLALWAVVACTGTETGNPGTRGCDPPSACGGCGAPIVLEIPSHPRRPAQLESIIVDSREIACVLDNGLARCPLPEDPYAVPDTYELMVEVPGFEPIELSVEVRPSSACCACEYEAVTVSVDLSGAS